MSTYCHVFNNTFHCSTVCGALTLLCKFFSQVPPNLDMLRILACELEKFEIFCVCDMSTIISAYKSCNLAEFTRFTYV